MKRQVALKRRGKPRFQYFGEVISELRKAFWPSRREATYLTTLVIIIALATALILGVVDFGFSKFINLVLLR